MTWWDHNNHSHASHKPSIGQQQVMLTLNDLATNLKNNYNNRRKSRKPTLTQEQHANSIHKGPGLTHLDTEPKTFLLLGNSYTHKSCQERFVSLEHQNDNSLIHTPWKRARYSKQLSLHLFTQLNEGCTDNFMTSALKLSHACPLNFCNINTYGLIERISIEYMDNFWKEVDAHRWQIQ